MSLFEMKNIKKSFDGKEVLKDISFSVEKGQVLAIIGPSGSGKSTILRIATGLETKDAGTYSLMELSDLFSRTLISSLITA